MITFIFGVQDLGRMRFAISPMWELVRSLVALRDPSMAAQHVAWLRGLDGRLGDLDLRPVIELVPPHGYQPDFLTPPPSGPLGSIEEDLEALRATPAERILEEMEIFAASHPRTRYARRWFDDPRGQAGRTADTLAAFWDRGLADRWPRVRALLEADLAHRARRLTEDGPAAVLSDLHRCVRCIGNRVEVQSPWELEVDLGGRGLLLMPSAFAWERPVTVTRAPWQPTLVYPARGVATLWEEGEGGRAGLDAVLGRTRSALLEALDAPRSTGELARRLGITPGGASQHLAALRAAGLVQGRRDGRLVLYVRTPVADELVKSA